MWDGVFRNVRICHGDKRAGNFIIQSGLTFWRNLNAEFRYGRLTFQNGVAAQQWVFSRYFRGTEAKPRSLPAGSPPAGQARVAQPPAADSGGSPPL